MRQAGWSGGEDGGRKRTGYLELTMNSWPYLCATETQESLQNRAQLEPGPWPGTWPRPAAATAAAAVLVAKEGDAKPVRRVGAASPGWWLQEGSWSQGIEAEGLFGLDKGL